MAQKKAHIINVGLIGLGTVGTGVARILLSKRRAILQRTGFDFRLKTVCVLHPKKKRRLSLKGVRITSTPTHITRDPDIDQVVELMGGTTHAHRCLTSALSNSKDVISANKALFAEKGLSLYRLSSRMHRLIGLEGSVGGGIPIIKAFKEGLASNRISSFYGILNGTCNLILTEMSQKGKTYVEALKKAQASGFAEKNPRLDVNGADTAHKLAILARLAFHREIPFGRIFYEGISKISDIDVNFSAQMGYTLKLLAIARLEPQMELRVHPVLLRSDHPLASIHGVNNAVLVRGDEVGEVLFVGEGAGERPTASAVVSDMIDIAKARRLGIGPRETIFSKAKVKPVSEVRSRYYLRFQVEDRPGMLGKLARVLGANGISISSVHQIEAPARFVPLIILTHQASEEKVKNAVRLIQRSSLVKQQAVLIRVE
jgi:homoserine dehydrogenase